MLYTLNPKLISRNMNLYPVKCIVNIKSWIIVDGLPYMALNFLHYRWIQHLFQWQQTGWVLSLQTRAFLYSFLHKTIYLLKKLKCKGNFRNWFFYHMYIYYVPSTFHYTCNHYSFYLANIRSVQVKKRQDKDLRSNVSSI